MSKLLALLSTLGLVASALGYMASFSATFMDTIFQWSIPLLLGAVSLSVPAHILSPSNRHQSTILLNMLAGNGRRWLVICSRSLALVVVLHMVCFLVHSGWGVPSIKDGQYVLNARGHTLKILTEGEYIALEQAAARTLSAAVGYIYFEIAALWWFGARRQDI